MKKYYAEFQGGLANNQFVQDMFYRHYNKWCDITNGSLIDKLNTTFDDQWTGEPIEDYQKNKEYQVWMLNGYREALINYNMDKDDLFCYSIDDNLQLIGTGRYNNWKGKQIWFVLKVGEA